MQPLLTQNLTLITEQIHHSRVKVILLFCPFIYFCFTFRSPLGATSIPTLCSEGKFDVRRSGGGGGGGGGNDAVILQLLAQHLVLVL